MEPLLLVLTSWWWAVPAAAAAGGATWAGVTAPRRRARRLELDASRREQALAYRALIAARAGVREGQARVLAARAGNGSDAEARRALQSARATEKHAAMSLRAARARVRASSAQYHAASTADPLPIDRLRAAHDAVLTRWVAYETDPDRALAFPTMTDPRHPQTLAFFQAQRTASELRPAPTRERITPDEFLAYREAVRALEAALDEAERAAGAAPAEPQDRGWMLGGWRVVPPQLPFL